MKFFYLDRLKSSIRANLQNGRGGACTVYFNAFDPEWNTILMLKHPMTPASKQIRGMDYNMTGNRFLGMKAALNEDVFTFNCYTAPDLYDAFYTGDEERFADLYRKYEADESFDKNYVSAREIIITSQTQALEVGRAYLSFADEINRHTPYKDPIYSSNLCVAPETMLLTDGGQKPIVSLAGQTVNVWNGEEFSEVQVVKTGEGQELVKVATSDGRYVEVTPYHKWYVVDGYGGKMREVRTHELNLGDKLIKAEWPVIEGVVDLERAYLNGFFTGDGCQMPGNSQRIDLYGEKKLLKDAFGEALNWKENDRKASAYVQNLRSKYYVPNGFIKLSARLEWLAGWLDADGSVARNGDNESLTGTSSNLTFLREVQDMLQTMGVNAKISKMRDAGYRMLPCNDGSGDYRKYYCETSYRLLISSGATQKLLKLGLPIKRLKVQARDIQREAEQFAVVTDIVVTGRIDDTYCVTEPKRHMAVFNGILTGQCAEIVEPTYGYEEMEDLYKVGPVGEITVEANERFEYDFNVEDVFVDKESNVYYSGLDLQAGRKYQRIDSDGVPAESYTIDKVRSLKKEPEVALCSLAGIVITNVKNDEEYERAMYYALLMIDICIHKSTYELPHVGYTAKARMAAAVGIMDYAHHLARKKLKYTDPKAKEESHRVAERHMYFAIKASIRLGKELGNAPWIHRTKWTEGWIPLDTYQKKLDGVVKAPLQYDWEQLRGEIIENGGIRNSTLVALMPGESSSKASGTVNSIYPIRELSMMKTDNNLTTYWCAPHSEKLGRYYQSAWEIPSKDMIEHYGAFQKFTDQAISADLFRKIEGADKVGTDEMLQEYFHMLRCGMKTRYYYNTHTSKTAVDEQHSQVNENIQAAYAAWLEKHGLEDSAETYRTFTTAVDGLRTVDIEAIIGKMMSAWFADNNLTDNPINRRKFHGTLGADDGQYLLSLYPEIAALAVTEESDEVGCSGGGCTL